MRHEKKTVLVTVKAYPNPSKKYGETVCVAGVDLEHNAMIRLYPMPFRDLDDEKKFSKYTIIEVNAAKAADDHRPESYRADIGSIEVVRHIDTGKERDWLERKKYVMPTVSKSMCAILELQKQKGASLGLFKPRNIDFIHQKARPADEVARSLCYAQLTFLNRAKNEIERIPYDFRYIFFCEGEPLCPGHNMQIIDWEIGQAFREWRRSYKDENVLLEKIKERWLARICSAKNDVHFYVGNTMRFRETFMVLGVFYPPL